MFLVQVWAQKKTNCLGVFQTVCVSGLWLEESLHIIVHPCFADAEFACAALARCDAASVFPCLHQSPASNAAAAAYLYRITAIEKLNISALTSRFHWWQEGRRETLILSGCRSWISTSAGYETVCKLSGMPAQTIWPSPLRFPTFLRRQSVRHTRAPSRLHFCALSDNISASWTPVVFTATAWLLGPLLPADVSRSRRCSTSTDDPCNLSGVRVLFACAAWVRRGASWCPLVSASSGKGAEWCV